MIIENAEEFTNEDLKIGVININQKQLRNIKRSSLLNIMVSLNASKELLKENRILSKREHKKEAEEIEKIIEEIKELVFNEDIDRTLEIREDLFKKKNILEGYLVEISFMGELVDEHGVKILSDTNDYKNFRGPNVNDLGGLIQETLNECQENYNKYTFIISEIVNVLPMNMVKQNYYDILRNTLTRNFKNYNRPAVDMAMDNYKKQFDSSTRDGYGMEFDNYFMEIQKIKRKDLASMDLDQLSDLVGTIIKVTEEVTTLRDLILSLGIMVNLLIVISKSEDIDIDKEEKLKEWSEAMEDEKALEKFDKEIRKEVNSIDKMVQDDLAVYEALTVELSQREDFDHDSLEDILMETRDLLTFYNDVGFSDIEFLETIDMNVVDIDYLDLAIDSLIDYLEISMTGMSNMERKIRMRKILSILDLPFENMQEFMNYIQYSLNERILDRKIINFKINQIVYFLNEIEDK